jgi:5-methylcytosine-specific restriction endonuclease McrA
MDIRNDLVAQKILIKLSQQEWVGLSLALDIIRSYFPTVDVYSAHLAGGECITIGRKERNFIKGRGKPFFLVCNFKQKHFYIYLKIADNDRPSISNSLKKEWEEIQHPFQLNEIEANKIQFKNHVALLAQVEPNILKIRVDGDKNMPDDYVENRSTKNSEPQVDTKDKMPPGNTAPKKIPISNGNERERDHKIIKWVLENADGNCECCNKPAPFTKNDGTQFLEVHHVIPLSEEGHDTGNNAIGICPNCHKELHFGENREQIEAQLYKNIRRLNKGAYNEI